METTQRAWNQIRLYEMTANWKRQCAELKGLNKRIHCYNEIFTGSLSGTMKREFALSALSVEGSLNRVEQSLETLIQKIETMSCQAFLWDKTLSKLMNVEERK